MGLPLQSEESKAPLLKSYWLSAPMVEWLALMIGSSDLAVLPGVSQEQLKKVAVEAAYDAARDALSQRSMNEHDQTEHHTGNDTLRDSSIDVVHAVLVGPPKTENLSKSVAEYFRDQSANRLKNWTELGDVKTVPASHGTSGRPRVRRRAQNISMDDRGTLALPSSSGALVLGSPSNEEERHPNEREVAALDSAASAILQAAIDTLSTTRLKNKDPEFYVDLISRLLETDAYQSVKNEGYLPSDGAKYGKAVSRIGKEIFPDHSNPTKKILNDLLPTLNRIIARARAIQSRDGGKP